MSVYSFAHTYTHNLKLLLFSSLHWLWWVRPFYRLNCHNNVLRVRCDSRLQNWTSLIVYADAVLLLQRLHVCLQWSAPHCSSWCALLFCYIPGNWKEVYKCNFIYLPCSKKFCSCMYLLLVIPVCHIKILFDEWLIVLLNVVLGAVI